MEVLTSGGSCWPLVEVLACGGVVGMWWRFHKHFDEIVVTGDVGSNFLRTFRYENVNC